MKITSILDVRIAGIVQGTDQPDRLSPEERARMSALLRRRNVCPDTEVDALDLEIITLATAAHG